MAALPVLPSAAEPAATHTGRRALTHRHARSHAHSRAEPPRESCRPWGQRSCLPGAEGSMPFRVPGALATTQGPQGLCKCQGYRSASLDPSLLATPTAQVSLVAYTSLRPHAPGHGWARPHPRGRLKTGGDPSAPPGPDLSRVACDKSGGRAAASQARDVQGASRARTCVHVRRDGGQGAGASDRGAPGQSQTNRHRRIRGKGGARRARPTQKLPFHAGHQQAPGQRPNARPVLRQWEPARAHFHR